jgi:xanthosine utilization system XapX-like protein
LSISSFSASVGAGLVVGVITTMATATKAAPAMNAATTAGLFGILVV